MATLPDKLKKDAISQAVFEIRFTCHDAPEVVVGRLAGHNQWKGWSVQRLPFADVPAMVRQQDPSLQYQPLMELRSDNDRLVRIGERSLSCFALSPYPGWTAWQPELLTAMEVLYSSFENFAVTRFGLRYINAIAPEHFVNGVRDLRISVTVAEAALAGPLLLHYQHDRDAEHIAITRISSREFVTNPQPPNLSAIVDVDVFTPQNFISPSLNSAKTWLGQAHKLAKEEFFRLLPNDVLQKLRGDAT